MSSPSPAPDDRPEAEDATVDADVELLPEAEIVSDDDRRSGQQPRVVARRETFSVRHAGPLPPADQLAQYDAVVPGLAERIVRMAEKEQSHRHEMTAHAVKEPFRLARRGQILAITSMVLVLAFGAFLVLQGNPTIGAIIAALDLVGLVALFITGEREPAIEEDDEEDVAEEVPPADNASREGDSN